MGKLPWRWRTLAGPMLLLIALPPCCLWVRSIYLVDQLNWVSGDFTRETVRSSKQRIFWTTIRRDPVMNFPDQTSPTWRTIPVSDFDEANDLVAWNWQFCGGGAGWSLDSYRQDLVEIVRMIPYWILVIPLACAGGCMLSLRLRRQRTIQAAKTTNRESPSFEH